MTTDSTTKTAATSKFYLKPADFFAEILKCQRNEQMSDKLGRMFMMVSEKYSNHQDFARYYHLREEFVGIGALACCKGFTKFKPLKEGKWEGEELEYDYRTCNNPFAFYTTVIRNAFLQFLKKEYGQSNVQNKMRSQLGMETTYGYNELIAEQEAEARALAELIEEVDDQDEFDVGSPTEQMGVWDDYGTEDSLVSPSTDTETQLEKE